MLPGMLTLCRARTAPNTSIVFFVKKRSAANQRIKEEEILKIKDPKMRCRWGNGDWMGSCSSPSLSYHCSYLTIDDPLALSTLSLSLTVGGGGSVLTDDLTSLSTTYGGRSPGKKKRSRQAAGTPRRIGQPSDGERTVQTM
jgi:hypothetical protein